MMHRFNVARALPLLLTLASVGAFTNVTLADELTDAESACADVLRLLVDGVPADARSRFEETHRFWRDQELAGRIEAHLDLVAAARRAANLPASVSTAQIRRGVRIALFESKTAEYRSLLALMGRETKKPRTGPRDLWTSTAKESDGSPSLSFTRTGPRNWDFRIKGTPSRAIELSAPTDPILKIHDGEIFEEILLSESEVTLADGRKFPGAWSDSVAGPKKTRFVVAKSQLMWSEAVFEHVFKDKWKWTDRRRSQTAPAGGRTVFLKEISRTPEYLELRVGADIGDPQLQPVGSWRLFDDHVEAYDPAGEYIPTYFEGISYSAAGEWQSPAPSSGD